MKKVDEKFVNEELAKDAQEAVEELESEKGMQWEEEKEAIEEEIDDHGVGEKDPEEEYDEDDVDVNEFIDD